MTAKQALECQKQIKSFNNNNCLTRAESTDAFNGQKIAQLSQNTCNYKSCKSKNLRKTIPLQNLPHLVASSSSGFSF